MLSNAKVGEVGDFSFTMQAPSGYTLAHWCIAQGWNAGFVFSFTSPRIRDSVELKINWWHSIDINGSTGTPVNLRLMFVKNDVIAINNMN